MYFEKGVEHPEKRHFQNGRHRLNPKMLTMAFLSSASASRESRRLFCAPGWAVPRRVILVGSARFLDVNLCKIKPSRLVSVRDSRAKDPVDYRDIFGVVLSSALSSAC